jgi:predicted dehydrogenase
VEAFIDSILKGGPSLISLEEIINTTEVTFGIVESIRTGKAIKVGE